jgi:hypothetical protein
MEYELMEKKPGTERRRSRRCERRRNRKEKKRVKRTELNLLFYISPPHI